MYMYRVAPQRKNNEQIDAFHKTQSTPAPGPTLASYRSVVEVVVGDEGHAERPPRRHDVVEVERLAAGGGDGEGELLAGERRVALPVGAPVAV